MIVKSMKIGNTTVLIDDSYIRQSTPESRQFDLMQLDEAMWRCWESFSEEEKLQLNAETERERT